MYSDLEVHVWGTYLVTGELPCRLQLQSRWHFGIPESSDAKQVAPGEFSNVCLRETKSRRSCVLPSRSQRCFASTRARGVVWCAGTARMMSDGQPRQKKNTPTTRGTQRKTTHRDVAWLRPPVSTRPHNEARLLYRNQFGVQRLINHQTNAIDIFSDRRAVRIFIKNTSYTRVQTKPLRITHRADLFAQNRSPLAR